jgi:molecular chaperone DnaJ
MAALNEAYRVLRNPGRRAAYDAGLAAVAATRTADRRPAYSPAKVSLRRVEDRGPARYPWKLVLVSAGVGAAVVLAAAALTEEAPPPRPDNVLEPGSCVAIEANEDAREVTCTGAADDLVVDVVVPLDGVCPVGLSAYRDRQGLGYACVSRRGPDATSESG